MKILITSGGTAEKIDQVRDITNQATGRLGQVMAEIFLAAGHEVSFLSGKHALLPEDHPNLTVYPITSVQSLINRLEPLVKTHQVLIHAMAVSDYTPIYMADFNQVAHAEDLTSFLAKTNQEPKISSQSDYQVLFLKKTPKVISLVKKWNPDICLIGFKLLVDVSEEELFQVARASLLKNQAEMIVANDLTQIRGDQHLAYLIDQSSAVPAYTKQEIAQKLLNYLEEEGERHV